MVGRKREVRCDETLEIRVRQSCHSGALILSDGVYVVIHATCPLSRPTIVRSSARLPVLVLLAFRVAINRFVRLCSDNVPDVTY